MSRYNEVLVRYGSVDAKTGDLAFPEKSNKIEFEGYREHHESIVAVIGDVNTIKDKENLGRLFNWLEFVLREGKTASRGLARVPRPLLQEVREDQNQLKTKSRKVQTASGGPKGASELKIEVDLVENKTQPGLRFFPARLCSRRCSAVLVPFDSFGAVVHDPTNKEATFRFIQNHTGKCVVILQAEKGVAVSLALGLY